MNCRTWLSDAGASCVGHGGEPMNHVDTPQTRCRAGVARCDITPPVGIYHRMWGAAVHDQATGVHRPLLATALWLEPLLAGRASDGRLNPSLARPVNGEATQAQ